MPSRLTLLPLALAVTLLITARSATAIPSLCDGDPHNIVKNCGFESGTTANWTQTGDWSIVTHNGVTLDGTSHSGSNHWDLGNAKNDPAGLDQTLTTISGGKYDVTF